MVRIQRQQDLIWRRHLTLRAASRLRRRAIWQTSQPVRKAQVGRHSLLIRNGRRPRASMANARQRREVNCRR